MFVFVCRGKQGNSYRLRLSALASQVTTQQDRRSTILCTVCFTEVNKAILIDCGCLPLLVKLLNSKVVEVQYCVYIVCFTEVNKAILIDCGCLPLLVKLLHSKVVEVQYCVLFVLQRLTRQFL